MCMISVPPPPCPLLQIETQIKESFASRSVPHSETMQWDQVDLEDEAGPVEVPVEAISPPVNPFPQR